MLAREKSLPRLPRSPTIHIIQCFIHLIIVSILSAGSQSVTINIREIKYEKKNPSPCKIPNAVDLTKRALKRMIIGLEVLDFFPGTK